MTTETSQNPQFDGARTANLIDIFNLQESDLLNLGTGSFSWFVINGYGCKAVYSDNITTTVDDPYRPRRPDSVENCLVDYFLVEVIHSGVQCLLAVR